MFTPVHTSLGALLLFSGSFGLLLHNGRVFGISSILRSGLMGQKEPENLSILAGLLSSPLLVSLVAPSLLPSFSAATTVLDSWSSTASTLGLGLLVGWGTKNGNGCTSGHMLCGLSRLSPRSLIATAVFFVTALLTANFAPSLTGCPQIIPACSADHPCYEIALPTTFELGVIATCTILSLFTNFVVLSGSNNKQSAKPESKRPQRLFAYLTGLQFGLGLLFSGMAHPAKVIRFFAFLTDINSFDPSLALVLLFGVGPSLCGYLAVKPGQPAADGKINTPTWSDSWRLPTRTVADIDWRFVAGAVAFGLGWGLSGVCPGPAILRAVLQPAWGIVWMGGYALGSLF